MNQQKINEIDDELRVNRLLKYIQIALVVIMGVNSALSISQANYAALPFDVIIVILMAMNISDLEEREEEMQAEKAALMPNKQTDNPDKT